ncbi:MAG TPA: CRISPR-associated endonuclease Cas1 [Aquificaceae bacterium]|nr:CRISPR-associated endonuclease Cas1 [Aquificaceae bacterium]HIQ48343.1 CRISPR-associated endonuclease Cas1 [Aquifex aeolicus]
MKRTFVVVSPASLYVSNERLCVSRFSKKVSVPLKHIDSLILMGEWSISSKLINKLLKERIPAFFLSRYGSLKGVLYADFFPSNQRVRLYQYEAYLNRREEVAKFLLRKKIEEIEKVFDLDLQDYKNNLERQKEVESLLGIEGFVSYAMFEAFRQKLKAPFDFQKREYRPPKDEVNALLSLYYTFNYCLALPVVLSSGYDPYISFIHVKRGKHASLCSDLLEPIRPHLTYHILEAFNNKLFVKEDFEQNGSGVYLKKEAFDKFLNFFERKKEENLKMFSEVLNNFLEVLIQSEQSVSVL